jgi:hypothetical protein
VRDSFQPEPLALPGPPFFVKNDLLQLIVLVLHGTGRYRGHMAGDNMVFVIILQSITYSVVATQHRYYWKPFAGRVGQCKLDLAYRYLMP